MMSSTGYLLERSKIVFFAGGSVFSHLQGVSKFIMDSEAFSAIRRFYFSLIRNETGKTWNKELHYYLTEHDQGSAFRYILTPDYYKNEREKNWRYSTIN